MSSISENDVLDALTRALNIGLSIHDRECNVIYQNDFIQNDLAGSEFLKHHGKCFRIYEGRDTRCEDCPVADAFNDGRIHKTERFVTTSDGEFLWSISAVPITNSEGDIVACLEIGVDIKERRQFKNKLAESERRLNALMDNLPGVVYRCRNDHEWTMEYLSNGCEPLLGYTSADLLDSAHLSFNELIIPEDRDSVWNTIQDALKQKLPYQITYRVRTARDETKWVWEKGSGIYDPSGEVVALEGFITDITERKRAEEALKENERFLSSIIENVPDVLLLKDAGDLGIVQLNKAGEDLLGIDRTELMGKLDTDVFPEDQANSFLQKDREVLESGRARDFPEEATETALGPRIFHTKRIPIFDEAGHPAFLLRISEDITHRKQEENEREKLQSQLIHAQKMESVGRLAGGVAHDFNNMLTVILGNTEIAMEQVEHTDSVYGNLAEIRTAAMRSTDLTKQLLAFARKQTIAPKVLDLNETVEGMLKMLRRLIGEDINLVWAPGSGLRRIKIDPTQIDQVLVNLCVNARDAIVGVGNITIETRMTRFTHIDCATRADRLPGEYAMVAVSDSGCGIGADILENLFEPFFTTKSHGKGTGLGLSMVYGIVTQNGGSIDVESTPGRGTTFRIYLPCIHDEAEDIEEESEGIFIPRGDETIMLVEDEAAILEIGKKMLTSLGYHVLSALLPSEALAAAEDYHGKIHLLISDVIMPEMNGGILADEFAVRYPGIRCLFVSGYTGNLTEHYGMSGNHVRFIEKPFSKQILATRVREILDG